MTARRNASKSQRQDQASQPRGPRPIADIVNHLLARHGYAREQAIAACEDAWKQAAGAHLAGHTRPGNIRRGVLEITVRNSTVLQELTFQKRQLLKKLQAAVADEKIKDLRFKVGAID